MDNAKESVRALLRLKATDETAKTLKEIHGVILPEGATNLDAINLVMLKKAEEGDSGAADIVKRYKLKEIYER